jgi:hypothetical protein
MAKLISNKNIPVIKNIQKTISEPYSASLTAICMLDMSYKELNIEISFLDITSLEIFYALCFNLWRTYKNIPLKIRSFKYKGNYLSEYNDMKMDTSINSYLTLNDFDNKKFIIDISYEENIYNIYFHLLHETEPRILTLKC